MEQETLDADNVRDEKETVDLGGIALYRLGMNLPQDGFFTVRYTDGSKRQSAVSGCSNKCRITGNKNILTVKQWEDDDGMYVTVKKAPKQDVVDIARLCNKLQKGSTSKDMHNRKAELYARLDAVDGGFSAAGYISKEEEDARAARSEVMYHTEQIALAVSLLRKGSNDDAVLFLGVEIDDLLIAKEQAKELEQKSATLILPGADDDWDKRDWTEEQIREHQIFDWIVHSCENNKDPITTAEEGRINLEIVKAIYAETQEAAAAKAKALRKAVIEDDKKRNPEKYLPKTKEKGEVNENA